MGILIPELIIPQHGQSVQMIQAQDSTAAMHLVCHPDHHETPQCPDSARDGDFSPSGTCLHVPRRATTYEATDSSVFNK